MFGSGNERNIKNLSISVSGMHCEGCSQTLEKTLLRNKSIRNVQADAKSGRVHVKFKDGEKINVEQIRRAIRQSGFIPGVEEEIGQ